MIAFCIAAGMLFRKYKLVPNDAHKGINTWIIYIALPAVSFKYIPKMEWTTEMFFPVLAMVVVWIGGWVFAEILSKRKGYKQRSRTTLELASGYSNTSFIGFPLVAAYFGEEHLGIAMICDQTSFVILSTAGIISALKAQRNGGGEVKPAVVVKKLITFPPLIALVFALILTPLVDMRVAEPFFDKLVVTVAPLALLSIGLQLRFAGWKKQFSQISLSVFYKLLIAPLLIFILALTLGVKGDIGKVSVLEAAMPTLLTGSIVAEQYGLNTKLLNLIIGISILVGMFTTGMWAWILEVYL